MAFLKGRVATFVILIVLVGIALALKSLALSVVAVKELRDNSGTQFDPHVVDIFIEKVLTKAQHLVTEQADLVPRYQEH